MLLSSTVFCYNIMDYCQFFVFCFNLQWMPESSKSDYPRVPVCLLLRLQPVEFKEKLMTPT